MAGPDPAVAQVRSAVRPALAASDQPVLVACSGGADSLALAAAVAFEAPRAGVRAGAVTVDHGLQAGSAERAEATAALLGNLGLDAGAWSCRADVGADGGPEAAARDRPATPPWPGPRGARRPRGCSATRWTTRPRRCCSGWAGAPGPRSVAGMVEHRVTGGVTWWRPLLGVRRDTTRAACAAQELPVWDDPWNADPAYTRVRLRTEVLPAARGGARRRGRARAGPHRGAAARGPRRPGRARRGRPPRRGRRPAGGRRRAGCRPRCAAGCCGRG